MATSDLTTEGHAAVAVGAAIAGAAALAVAAPVLMPILGLGAVGALVTGSAPAIGAAVGGWLGWKAAQPSDQKIQQLVDDHK